MGRRGYSRYDQYYPYYAPTKPKEVKGGIKAQSKKGSFGETWWARRWLDVLESFQIGERLNRGKSYARKGQVLSIDITPGVIMAKVQGSRATPYRVTIKMNTLPAEARKKIASAMADNLLVAAKLQGGELPESIEDIFSRAGAPLFPLRYKDLSLECSCPDWSNPCKHGAAVCFLLAEEFDRDPFLLLTLRGLERGELLSFLPPPESPAPPVEAPRKRARKKAAPSCPDPSPPAERPAEYLPLSADHASFWGDERLRDSLFFPMEPPPPSAAPSRRLGAFPFWRGSEPFLEALEEVYRNASHHTPAILAGAPPDPAR
jgi:uncharacterized Zn finger protein